MPNESTPEFANFRRQVDSLRAVVSLASDAVLAYELLDAAVNGPPLKLGVVAIAAVGSAQGYPVFKRMFNRSSPWDTYQSR